MENRPLEKQSPALRWAWLLGLLTALFWVAAAVAYALRPWSAIPDTPWLRWALALMMLGNAAASVWIGWGLRKQRRPFYYIALVYLALNFVLTIFDDLGWVDWLYMAFVGVLFVLLLRFKKAFIPQ